MSHDEVRGWVRALVAKHQMKQEDLAELLNLSQASVSSRLIGKPGSPPFKMHEIEILERHFGELSPLRRAPAPKAPDGESIDPKILRAVLRHLTREYPHIIRTEPDKFADAVIALCDYVQQTDGRQLTRAESFIAMRALTVVDD